MGLYFAGALSWPLNGTFVAESGSAEERGFSSFATKCLQKHNAYRNLHKNTPKMTLDQTLQDGAQVNSHAVGMTFELTPFYSRNGRIIWNLLVNSNIHLQVNGQVRNGYNLSYIFRFDLKKNNIFWAEIRAKIWLTFGAIPRGTLLENSRVKCGTMKFSTMTGKPGPKPKVFWRL